MDGGCTVRALSCLDTNAIICLERPLAACPRRSTLPPLAVCHHASPSIRFVTADLAQIGPWLFARPCGAAELADTTAPHAIGGASGMGQHRAAGPSAAPGDGAGAGSGSDSLGGESSDTPLPVGYAGGLVVKGLAHHALAWNWPLLRSVELHTPPASCAPVLAQQLRMRCPAQQCSLGPSNKHRVARPSPAKQMCCWRGACR